MSVLCRGLQINLVFLLFLGATARAQEPLPAPIPPSGRGSGAPASITGKVVLPSGHGVSNSIKIRLSNLVDVGMYVYTDNTGAFAFPNLAAGIYTIEAVGDPKLYDTVTEQVNLLRGMRANVLITLREKATTNNGNGNVVSAGELDPGVPSAARKEYDAATKLAAADKYQEAIERYRRALAIYPNYLKAHNDLGAQYLKLKRLDEAAEQFEAALDINPKAFNPQLNLGIVLVQQKKFTAALDHLTQALALDSSSAAAHLYFGIAAVETDDLDAGHRELNTALSIGDKEYAVAHFYLAQFHLKNGDRNAAVSELKSYLAAAPTGEEANRARQLLKEVGEGK